MGKRGRRETPGVMMVITVIINIIIMVFITDLTVCRYRSRFASLHERTERFDSPIGESSD